MRETERSTYRESGDPFSVQPRSLGRHSEQASPGNHSHRVGNDSKLLLEGFTLTGSKGSNVALANLIAILRDNFGLTDNTT